MNWQSAYMGISACVIAFLVAIVWEQALHIKTLRATVRGQVELLAALERLVNGFDAVRPVANRLHVSFVGEGPHSIRAVDLFGFKLYREPGLKDRVGHLEDVVRAISGPPPSAYPPRETAEGQRMQP